MSDSQETVQNEAPETGGFKMGGVAKHAIIYGLGTMASKALSFIMLPIYTRFLTTADYGVMGLIEMTLDFISIIAGAQLALAIFRFYHKTDDESEKRAVVSTALLALAISYAVIGLGSYLAADFLAALVFSGPDVTPALLVEYGDLIRIASIALAFQSMLIVPLSFARVRERSGLYVAANLTKLFLSLLGNIVFLIILGMGVKGIFISNLIASAVVGIAMTFWTTKQVGLRFSRNATKDLLRYGIPMIGMQFATFAATFGDRFFLQASWGEDAVGLYNLAYQFGFILALLGAMPFEQIWAPKRFELVKRDDRDTIYANAFVYSNAWLLTLAMGIVLFIDDLFIVMTRPAFYPAGDLVPLILLAYLLQAWAGIQDIGILVREKTIYLTVANWIAAIVGLASYWYLIPRYGGMGAAVGTVLAFSTRWIFTYRYSQKLWYVKYRWSPVLRITGIVILLSLIAIFMPAVPIYLSIPIHVVMFGVYLAAVWTLGGLTADEKQQAITMAGKGLALARNLRSR